MLGLSFCGHAPAQPGPLEVCCAGEVEEVGAFSVVEFQGPRQGFEDAVGYTGEVSALEPVVVINAHPGHCCKFLAAEPGHPAQTPVHGQPCHFRGDPGTARLKEFAHFAVVAHFSTVRANKWLVGGTAITWNTSHYLGFGYGG